VEVTEGYLLDNNIISILVQPADPRYPGVRANFDAIKDDSPIILPVIALAEIEFGLAIGTDNQEQAMAIREFFSEYPDHYGVGDNTIEFYALLRSQIWRDYGTRKKKRNGFEEKRPEELVDRVTGQSLGIDERDLLIASVAAEYRLVLATNDQKEGMKRIERAAKTLENDGKPVHLRIEYWPH
jgi:predicted nucleic acid-binding protein